MSSTLPARDAALSPLLAPPPADAPPTVSCRNCGGPVGEHYCGSCGQRHATRLDPSLRDVLHDASQEFLSVDGKIVETLKRLVMVPGGLTADHLAGRRARYVAPLRVYLTCSLLYFLLVSLTPGLDRETYERFGRDTSPLHAVAPAEAPGSTGSRTAGGVFRRGIERMRTDPAATERTMTVAAPRIMFALVPFFALLLRWAYRREGRRFPGHLYFAIHLFSFYFLVSVAQRLVGLTGSQALVKASMWVLVAVMATYITLALERVYGTSRWRAVRRTVFLLAQFVVGMGLVAFVTMVGMLGLE